MRYNVLVVEDEMPILRGICKSIEECNPNFYVSATALNGRAAIEALKNQQFQLVVADINMPVLSGLDVLKYIQQNHPEIVTVVLSGYQDFHYAQQALKLGARDYLLKPLKRAELSSLLSRVEARFQKQKELYARHILDQDDNTADRMLSTWNMPAWLAVVYIGSYQLQQSEMLVTESTRSTENWLRTQLDNNYGKSNYSFVPGARYAARLLLLAPSVPYPWQSIRRILDSCQSNLLPVTIAACPEPIEPQAFLSKYNDLRNMARQRMLFEESSLLLEQDSEAGELGSHAAEQLRGKEIRTLLDEYRDALLTMKRPRRSAVVRMTKNYAQAIMQHVQNGCSYFDVEEDVLLMLESTWDRKILIQKFRSLILQATTVPVIEEDGKKQIAVQLQTYLEENMDQYITLELLERKFGYVAAHLRELFREHYGCSPLEYLLNLRMEKAQQMLTNQMAVKDVAEAVGFQDALYFSKVFKRSTGYSPSEYRRNAETGNLPR